MSRNVRENGLGIARLHRSTRPSARKRVDFILIYQLEDEHHAWPTSPACRSPDRRASTCLFLPPRRKRCSPRRGSTPPNLHRSPHLHRSPPPRSGGRLDHEPTKSLPLLLVVLAGGCPPGAFPLPGSDGRTPPGPLAIDPPPSPYLHPFPFGNSNTFPDTSPDTGHDTGQNLSRCARQGSRRGECQGSI
jgi:hypothetical protein